MLKQLVIFITYKLSAIWAEMSGISANEGSDTILESCQWL